MTRAEKKAGAYYIKSVKVYDGISGPEIRPRRKTFKINLLQAINLFSFVNEGLGGTGISSVFDGFVQNALSSLTTTNTFAELALLVSVHCRPVKICTNVMCECTQVKKKLVLNHLKVY